MPRCQDGVLRNLAGPLLLSSLTGRLRGTESAHSSAFCRLGSANSPALPLLRAAPAQPQHTLLSVPTERSRSTDSEGLELGV